MQQALHSRRGFAAALAPFALLLAACGEGSADAASKEGVRRGGDTPVVVGRVQRMEFADRIEALGSVVARESVVITADVTERVKRVHFDDGQLVEAGDVLVELTSDEESAQLAEAAANYHESLRQYRRTADLVQRGTESEARLDERLAARDAARARLEELRARMADRLVLTPFKGVLGLRTVSPGTLVRPGDAITTLDDVERVKLDFSVPETFLASLAPGLQITATSAAYPDRSFTGAVKAIDTRVDERTRAVKVRAELPNPELLLRPGMLLSVELSARPRTSLALPEEALVPRGDRQFVFVVDAEQRAQRVAVSIGRRKPGFVELRSGLSGDETIVVDGGARLHEGATVRAIDIAAAPGT